MMLRKLVLPALMVMGVNASADESYFQDEWDAKGLIGIEVGYMGTEYQIDEGRFDINNRPIIEKKTTASASFGLKLGGESKHYRVFFEGRYWNTDEYKYAGTVGGALQYLIRVDEKFNLFLGLNAGVINVTNSEWDPYAGGDAGINIDVNERFGIEVGGRYSAVDVNSDASGKINAFYQGYVSGIFKFTTDY